MAVAGVQVNINSAELREFAQRLREYLPPRQAALVLGAAVRKAIKPLAKTLREITPVGPTGNLKRAATSKVVEYKESGVAVGIVGYRRAKLPENDPSAAGGTVKAGPERGYHQWWLEYGTKARTIVKFSNKPYKRRSPSVPFRRVRMGREEIVRGRGVMHEVSGQNAYIASSFNRLGPFKFDKAQKPRVATDPSYPKAFFKKSKTPIVIPPMPIGGWTGNPPVQTAFMRTQGEVAAILQRELGLSLSEAWSTLRVRSIGSATGTDSLGPG